MIRKLRKLVLGGEGPKPAKGGYFNPLTGRYDGDYPFTQYYNLFTRERHRFCPGMNILKVRAGDTDGYKRVTSYHVPGYIWIPAE